MARSSFKKSTLIVSLAMLAYVLPAHAQVESMSALIKRLKPAIVTVMCFDSTGQASRQGSAFFIDSTHLISCRHVFETAYRAEYRGADEKIYPVLSVVADAFDPDLIKVEVAKRPDKFKPLKLAKDIPEQGDKVIAIGTPAGMEQTVSDGIVSAVRKGPTTDQIIQVTAPISAGSSGGPVLNASGEVIGVASFIFDNAENLNFATPSQYIRQLKDHAPMPMNIWGRRSSMGEQHIEGKTPQRQDTQRDENLQSEEEYAADYAMGRGIDYMDKRDYKRALEMFQNAVQAVPTLGDGWTAMGEAYFAMKQIEPAAKALEKAVALMPNAIEPKYFLGHCYYVQHKFPEALKQAKEVLALDSTSGITYYSLGQTYVAMQNDSLAIPAYQQAIRYKAERSECHFMLATIYGRRGQFSRAVEEIKSSLTFGPFADGWACLGDVFYDEGKKDSALICYRNAMAMHPEDPQTLESIADNFFHLDQFKEAEHALQESLRLRNEHGRTHYELGLCEAALKKNKEAIAEYKLAIKYDPDFPPAHYSLGLAYLNDLHDKPAALDEYKILLPLDKDIAGLLFQEIYK